MSNFFKYIFGPRLLRVYPGIGDQINSQAMDYVPKTIEKWGDTVLTSLSYAASLALYTSPFILPIAYRRGWCTTEGVILMTKFLTGVGIVVVGAMYLRALGKFTNPIYSKFLQVLLAAQADMSAVNKKELSKFDFDFCAWPVEFRMSDVEGDASKPRSYLDQVGSSGLIGIPLDALGWLLTHSFGLKMVYPGSIQMLQAMVERPLMDGRMKLIEAYGGQRFKLLTRDNNSIDTLFVEQKSKSNGKTLVICCEGNAGFYEIGVMATPLEAGYSVVGWNHPGFYGSTGEPFPPQEAAAADAVIQFAIHKLGYSVENILVTGWSIGGFTASWLAMNYPEIKGLILDATFDDLVPLAIPRMPGFMSPLVERGIKKYINLNVADQVAKYPGPLKLIRRTRDEMISTSEGELWSNRGNNLLLCLLFVRYPNLSSAASSLEDWLSVQGLRPPQDEDLVAGLLWSYIDQHGATFPCMIGEDMEQETKEQLLIYLASKHMSEIDTSHCTPLPASHFTLPWDPAVDSQFVNVCQKDAQSDSCSDE